MTSKQFLIAAGLAFMAASLSLSGCGRRGDLEPPSGRGSLEDAVIEHNGAPAQSSKKPERSFILDALI